MSNVADLPKNVLFCEGTYPLALRIEENTPHIVRALSRGCSVHWETFRGWERAQVLRRLEVTPRPRRMSRKRREPFSSLFMMTASFFSERDFTALSLNEVTVPVACPPVDKTTPRTMRGIPRGGSNMLIPPTPIKMAPDILIAWLVGPLMSKLRDLCCMLFIKRHRSSVVCLRTRRQTGNSSCIT